MKEKLRVLFAVQNLVRGGAEQLSVDICNELIKHPDVEVLLVSFSEENEFVAETKHIPIAICNSDVRLSLLRKNSINLDEFRNITRNFKPHVIHSNVYKCELI